MTIAEEQTYEQNSSREVYEDVPWWILEKQKDNIHCRGNKTVAVQWWISTKEVNKNSTDPVNVLLISIQKRWSNPKSLYWKLPYVNPVFVTEDRPILFSIHQEQQHSLESSDVMETYKLHYLGNFLVNRAKTTVEEVARGLQQRDPPKLERHVGDGQVSFFERYIVDGCFIIELFLKNEEPAQHDFFMSERLLHALSRDLLLPSNQELPLVVLIYLYEKSRHSEISNHDGGHNFKQFTKLAFNFLKRVVPNQKLNHMLVDVEYGEHGEICLTNLVDLVYKGLVGARSQPNNDDNSNIDKDKKDGDNKWTMVNSATKLEEFGVEFKVVERDSFIDINFTNEGVLEIPCLCIRPGIPYSIKALHRHEQTKLGQQQKPLNDYLRFMNSLVKSPRDVRLLCEKGIIDNLSELPDDAAIYKFLKDFQHSLTIPPTKYWSYIKVYKDLGSHCKCKRNRWMAKLKRDYFNSPWSIISFFVASLFLILTIVQTVFSVASYYKHG